MTDVIRVKRVMTDLIRVTDMTDLIMTVKGGNMTDLITVKGGNMTDLITVKGVIWQTLSR